MKKLFIFFICAFAFSTINAQSIIGAWERFHTSDDGQNLLSVVIFAEGFQVLTTYKAETGEFLHTNGGTWSLDGNTMTEKVEFNSEDASMVGKEVSFEINLTNFKLSIIGDDKEFDKVDNGTPGKLGGAWVMSGRMRDGEMHSRDTDLPRKTMKLLSGTRFQWIAYNTETKQFLGTGGGNYTTKDGKYTEIIEFFSRDNTRVGASLEFDYSLEEGEWHHQGLSSKGQPIYEIWSLRDF